MDKKEWWVRQFQEADELTAYRHLREALITRKPFHWDPLKNIPKEEQQPFRIIVWLLRRRDTRQRTLSFLQSCLEDANLGVIRHGLTPIPILQSAFWCFQASAKFEDDQLAILAERFQRFFLALSQDEEGFNKPMLMVLQALLHPFPLTVPYVEDAKVAERLEKIKQNIEWLPAEGECATTFMKCWIDLQTEAGRSEEGIRSNLNTMKEVFKRAEILRKTYTEDSPRALECEHFGRENYLQEHASDLLVLLRLIRQRLPDLHRRLDDEEGLEEWRKTLQHYSANRRWS